MELSPEERDQIFQEEKARRDAQERLKREEKQRNARYGCLGCLGLAAVAILAAMIGGLFSEPHKNDATDVTGRQDVAGSAPRPSGNPVVAYTLKRPHWPVKLACGTRSMNVIVARPVNEQELIDLAFDLHTRYPDTAFEILDDESRLKDFDEAADLVSAEHRLGASALHALVDSLKPWQDRHYVAAISLLIDGGSFKWQLEGADGHPTRANEHICDLDQKIISPSECVAGAAHRAPK